MLTKDAQRAETFEARPGSLSKVINMPAARMHVSRGDEIVVRKQSLTGRDSNDVM